MEHHCRVCNIPLTNKYGDRWICRECYIKQQQEQQAKKKLYIYNYLSTHPCEECGESRPVVLEFHHAFPGKKEYDISDMKGYSFDKINKEISKCNVLCSNCHKVITAKEKGRYNFLNYPNNDG